MEVRIVKILGQPGLEIAIPSTHNHEATSYVIITRGTQQFVDEVHDHKDELRPSTELLSALQKSEGSINETCAYHVTSRYGNKEVCANNLSSPPSGSFVQKDYHFYERVNSTRTNTVCTELHSLITFHHANTRGSSARIVHLCP